MHALRACMMASVSMDVFIGGALKMLQGSARVSSGTQHTCARIAASR
jgi:hypothetical protein